MDQKVNAKQHFLLLEPDTAGLSFIVLGSYAFTPMQTVARLLLFPYWILCFVLTHIPNPKSIPTQAFFDKVLHFSGYFVLGFLLAAFYSVKKKTPQALFKACFITLLIYGAIDETTQPYFGRDFEWFDLLADLLGVSTAVLLFLKIFPLGSLDQSK